MRNNAKYWQRIVEKLHASGVKTYWRLYKNLLHRRVLLLVKVALTTVKAKGADHSPINLLDDFGCLRATVTAEF